MSGWASVVILLIGLFVAGIAVDVPTIAGLGPGGGSQTRWMAPVMVLGGLVGLVLARSRLGAVLAHLVGALVGTTVLLLAWAATLSSADSLEARLAEISAALARFAEAAVLGQGRHRETIGFLILIGAVAWTTGQYSAFNLVRRGLVVPAIVATGTFLLVVTLAPRVDAGPIYPHLVALTGIGLVLVLRARLVQQEHGWRHRQVTGAKDAGRTAYRGGILVAAVGVIGAAVLAANVAGAPLRDSVSMGRLLDLGALFGPIGAPGSWTDIGAGAYSDIAPIPDAWTPADDPAFRWRGETELEPYWWGAAFPTFRGDAWIRPGVERHTREVVRGTAFPAGGPDGDDPTDREPGEEPVATWLSVTDLRLRGGALVAPLAAVSADQDAWVTTDGEGGPLLQIDLAKPLAERASYRVMVQHPATGPTDGAAATRLRPEPRWLQAYLEVPTDSVSTDARRVAEGIAGLGPDRLGAAELAARMEAFFAASDRGAAPADTFRYATDLTGVCEPGEGVVDCLLRSRQGFCVQYATAMTLLLRSQGVPARFVLGYLPGEALADGSHLVKQTAAHAWVEAYIAGSGWVRFDPTPGGATLEALGQRRSGVSIGGPGTTTDPDAAADPGSSAPPTAGPGSTDRPASLVPPAGEAPPDGPAPIDPLWAGLLALVLLAVLVVVGALVGHRRSRRSPGRDADLLYRAIVALAVRVGFRPRATQTPFEVSAMIGKAVPAVRHDLETVARAKVRASYAGGSREEGVPDELLHSFRRVRSALIWLRLRRRIGR